MPITTTISNVRMIIAVNKWVATTSGGSSRTTASAPRRPCSPTSGTATRADQKTTGLWR
jgi:hypothetical protein